MKRLIILGILSLFYAELSMACPKIDGLVDFNCDGKHRVVVTGDSVVFGVGDELQNGKGGYVSRLKNFFPKSRFIKLGYPGITTSRLYGFYRDAFRTKSQKGSKLLLGQLAMADILIIDVGRNDYFNRNDPSITVNTIKAMATFFTQRLKKENGVAPLIAIATLLPSNRIFDVEFLNEINTMELASRSEKFPAYIRFDLIDHELLSEDGLHPSSAGYSDMAEVAAEYIADGAQVRSIALRKDNDDDGIYDIFEKKKFQTDPKVADSDTDGLKDGKEVFTYKTNPNVVDTDGDGVSDGDEVLQGTDPKKP